MQNLKFKRTYDFGRITITCEQYPKFIFSYRWNELNACCAIRMLTDFAWNFGYANQEVLNEAFKFVIDSLRREFRLCLLTHNTVDGQPILTAAKACGFRLDHTVLSNHPENGEVELLSLVGDQPDPEPEEDY